MSLSTLLKQIKKCSLCSSTLPHAPKPVIGISSAASILVIGQAPGKRVHETGITWNDKSGERLMQWMGIGPDIFFDPGKISMMPMGFCYPGKGPSGDLPPRGECAPAWHDKLLKHLPAVKLILLIGSYSQKYYLHDRNSSLTDNVRGFRSFLPYFPLPHPSPRNFMWFRQNKWFDTEVVPTLQDSVKKCLH